MFHEAGRPQISLSCHKLLKMKQMKKKFSIKLVIITVCNIFSIKGYTNKKKAKCFFTFLSHVC